MDAENESQVIPFPENYPSTFLSNKLIAEKLYSPSTQYIVQIHSALYLKNIYKNML